MSQHPSSRSVLIAVLLLLAAMLGVQGGASYAKRLFETVGPTGATTLRLMFASIILLAYARPWRYRLDRADLKALLIYGVSLGGMNMMIYQALARIPLGIAVALEFVGPLVVALTQSRKGRDLLWVLMAAIGIVLFLPFNSLAQPLDSYGVMAALLAGACWGIYILSGKRIAGTVPGEVITAWGMTIGMLMALPFGLWGQGMNLFRSDILVTALIVGVVASVIPYTLELVALARLPSRTFSVLMSLEPVVAAFFGMVVLGEFLSPVHWVAIGCIMIASAGCTMSASPAPAPTPEMTP